MRLLDTVFLAFLLLVPVAGAVTAPSVTLSYPVDSLITNDSSEITLSCGASDDENIYSVSLYHDMGGNYSLNSTNRTMGFQVDSYTRMLCGFDGTYECLEGESGTASGTTFEDSWMGKGVLVDGTDTLTYPTGGVLDYDQGTIEMWVRVGFDPNDDAYLFSTDDYQQNALQIYTEYGFTDLVFAFFDDYTENSAKAIADISSWQPGEWHHVAAVWDINSLIGGGNEVGIFIDGSDLYEHSGYFYSKGPGFSSPMYIGSQKGGTMQSNSLIDELEISSRVLTAEEINTTYKRLMADHSSGTFNWTFYDVPDGTYTWNCMAYDNESNSSWGAANYTFTVDAVTPPTVNSISFDAESGDYIDPGIALNATVNASDVSNVSSVILMYKSPYAGLYTNDSMDYNEGTGLWENGTIVTNTDEGNWSYRIFSKDSWGHAGLTSVYSVDVSKERSWTVSVINSTGGISDSFGEVTGFGGAEKNLGILVINNTGDYVSGFDLSAEYTGTLAVPELSYNVSEPFDLQPKEVAFVNVNVTVPDTENEYLLDMNITTTSVPQSRSVNGTVVSSIDVPFINRTVDITSSPATVPQSSGANFTAKVKNIGNETAENVTLNWSFTSGWSMSYGNESQFIGNVSPYETVYVTVTLSAGSGATAGAAFVWINASDVWGSTVGDDMAVVSVTCSSGDGVCGSGCTSANDDDCEAASTGGGTKVVGVGTIIVPGEPSVSVSLPTRIDLDRGGKTTFRVNVTSTGGAGTNVTGVRIGLSGYDAALLEVSPPVIGHIKPDETVSFTVTVDVPSYVEERQYLVTVTLTADGVYSGGTMDVEATRSVIFAVHAVLQNDTLSALESAEEALADMQSAGLSTGRVEDMLDEARRDYESMDYGHASDIAEEIVSLKMTAFGMLSSFEQLDGDMAEAESYGIGIDETKRMEELARAAFQRGDYSRAEERLGAALNTFQLETKNVIDLLRFLRSYWYALLAVLAAVILSGIFGRKRLRIRAAEGRLGRIRRSREAVRGMLRELQKDYYERRAVSKMEYQATKESYEKRLASLAAEEINQKRKIALIKSGGGRKELEESRRLARDMLRKLQSDYFEKGLMGKDAYKTALREIEGELDRIERELVKAGKGSQKKGIAYVAFVAVVAWLLYSSFSGVTFTGNVASSGAADITEATVQEALNEAAAVIGDMDSLGFPTDRPNTTLENARIAFGRGDYSLALTTARYVKVIKQKAVLVYDLLDEVEVRIHDISAQGLDTTPQREMFSDALALFEGENYEDAETKLTAALDQLDEKERNAALERAARTDVLGGIYGYVKDNTAAVAGFLAVTAVACVIVGARLRKTRKKRYLSRMEKEREEIRDSMAKLQEDYFRRGIMSDGSYRSRMEKYRKDLADVTERIASEKLSKRGK